MSNVLRRRATDRILLVTVNLRRRVQTFATPEYRMIADLLEGARRRGFLLCGYALMPDPGHALIWAGHPLTISQGIHDIKKVSARKLHAQRRTDGSVA